MVNEIMLMCDRLGIDVWEVIDRQRQSLTVHAVLSGPGVGGHCIPVDPIYLSWKARGHGFEARFIDLRACEFQMPHYVIEKVVDGLNAQKKSLNGSKVLVIGVAYKKDVKDLRESPALEVVELLGKKGAVVSYYDRYCHS